MLKVFKRKNGKTRRSECNFLDRRGSKGRKGDQVRGGTQARGLLKVQKTDKLAPEPHIVLLYREVSYGLRSGRGQGSGSGVECRRWWWAGRSCYMSLDVGQNWKSNAKENLGFNEGNTNN